MGLKKIIGTSIFLVVLTLVVKAQPIMEHTLALINSTYDEQNPVLSADGNYLFVTRSNHPENVGGLKDPGDIWYLHFNGAAWGPLTHGGTVLNDKGYNTVIGTSRDGLQLYIANHQGMNGEVARTQGLSVASFQQGKWSSPVNISIPYFHSKTTSVQGRLSADAHYFVYAAETYGTTGVEDIFVVSQTDNGWSEPLNLGTQINTALQELSPSLSKTNDTLFFSSNGRKGMGSFDVYAAVRQDDSWTRWSEPVNLTQINTEGRELCYLSLGDGTALYTSTLNSDGYGDLRIYPSGRLPEIDTVKKATLAQEFISPVGIRVQGKVLNSKTSQLVYSTLRFVSSSDTHLVVSNEQGYKIQVVKAQPYHVTIEAEGYISTFQTLVPDTLQSGILEMDFLLQPIEVGTTVTLKNVLFKQSSTDMLPESKEELDVVVSFMRTNPTVKILLTGHTDNRGIHKDNVRLSQARVEKVKDYLVVKGISSKRISGKGIGGAKPIANNESDESRKLNRRVEFTIVKN